MLRGHEIYAAIVKLKLENFYRIIRWNYNGDHDICFLIRH